MGEVCSVVCVWRWPQLPSSGTSLVHSQLLHVSRAWATFWWKAGGTEEDRERRDWPAPSMYPPCQLEVTSYTSSPGRWGALLGLTVHTKTFASLLSFSASQWSFLPQQNKYNCVKIPFVIGQSCCTGKSSLMFYYPHWYKPALLGKNIMHLDILRSPIEH